MNLLISQLYCAYLKFVIKFMIKSKILSVRISEVTRLVKKMKTKDIFTAYEHFDSMITQIIQMFENNDFCRKHRLHQNFVYMIFLDLVKIYNVFYIMSMETLDRYKKMSSGDMAKAVVLYKNFCNFTDTLRKEANTIPMLFGFSFKEPNYYKPDANKEKAMKRALKDKESGGGGFEDDEDFGEEAPEFEEQNNDFADDDDKDDDNEGDSDDEYQFDLLSDVKKQEQMASVSGGNRNRGKTQVFQPKGRIVVDDFNTAALDDLLGAGEVKPHKPSTMGAINDGYEEEWDPFAKKQDNMYSTSQPVQEVGMPRGGGNNIFGDQDDMWGDNPTPSDQPASKAQQKQTLDNLLGGEDDYQDHNQNHNQNQNQNQYQDQYQDQDQYQNQGRSQSMAIPNNDYDMLKNLYNTSSAAPVSNMGMGQQQQQQNYYNTGAPDGGYNNSMGGGYNNNMGGGYNNNNNMGGGYGNNMQGYNPPQANQFATGYTGGGGYNDSGMGGYNNYGAGQFNTGMAAGYNQQNTGYNTGFGAQNTGYNTSAPNQQQNQNNDFDPFA
jgi:hypothetical protein